jgi:molecular chaperone DnaK (HSP70)
MSEKGHSTAVDFGGTNLKLAWQTNGPVRLTPCAVWQDPQHRLVVGRRALAALPRDPNNAFADFKRHLGTATQFTFARSGQMMLAEELCAEVLKSARSNSETYGGEPVTLAVITVPVAFGSAQCEAMRRSATLAGIENHLFLQEPIAAALAHGIERPDDTAPWLVYDLGGSTFSVSVLYKRNGVLQVAGHAGDSHLGGRDIDWAIVQQLLIPALRSERRLVGIDSNDARWRSAVHTLMLHAEAAKIRLSSQERTDIIIDALCDDDRGDPVEFEFELNRKDLERLATPYIRRTVALCKEAMVGLRLTFGDMEKVVLAGGSASIPGLREQLREDLGGTEGRLECGEDPSTVIARGAAIFAGLQCTLTDREPEVGLFASTPHEPDRDKTFACSPTPALPGSVGIWMANNEVLRLFEKGTPLPARRRVSMRSSHWLRKGDSGEILRLRLVEGESQRADRNREFCNLSLPVETVRSDLPAGTEIDVTIEIVENWLAKVNVYIPLLDEEVETKTVMDRGKSSPAVLAQEFEQLKVRLDSVLALAQRSGQPVSEELRKAAERYRSGEIAELLSLATDNAYFARRCDVLLDSLSPVIVDAEDTVEWAAQQRDFEDEFSRTRGLLAHSNHASVEDVEAFGALEGEANKAIGQHDAIRLKVCSEKLQELYFRVAQQEPDFWVAFIDHLSRRRSDFVNLSQADALLDRAKTALNGNNLAVAREAARSLMLLLPSASAPASGHCGILRSEQESKRVAPPRPTTAEVPTARIDKVHFAVTAPAMVSCGQSFLVDVWAHFERQRVEIERRIRQSVALAEPAPVIRPAGPFAIARGVALYVRLHFPDLVVENPEAVILWAGEIGTVSFLVSVPPDNADGRRTGWITVHWEGCLQIARVPLQILVTARPEAQTRISQPVERLHKAFASYASDDRDEVLHRIQGMQKIVPDLEVFMDVAKLRSGDDWEARLWRVIPEQDVFYLFWSRAARGSTWVEKEWRCALKARGLSFIDPVPLEPPDVAEPPEELKKKHFNDWVLAYDRSRAHSL